MYCDKDILKGAQVLIKKVRMPKSQQLKHGKKG